MNTPAINQAGSRPDDIRNSRKIESPARMMPKAPGNRWHNLIATNATIALGSRLAGNKGEIYVNGVGSSDHRLAPAVSNPRAAATYNIRVGAD